MSFSICLSIAYSMALLAAKISRVPTPKVAGLARYRPTSCLPWLLLQSLAWSPNGQAGPYTCCSSAAACRLIHQAAQFIQFPGYTQAILQVHAPIGSIEQLAVSFSETTFALHGPNLLPQLRYSSRLGSSGIKIGLGISLHPDGRNCWGRLSGNRSF